jgi:hypothetical protein
LKKLDESGQSTIEFIFTFVFGVSIIFLIFNSAMNHATGYLVHYATFMASRSYLTSDNYIGTFGGGQPELYHSVAEQRARDVFNQYNLGVFNVDSSGFRINHAFSGSAKSEYLTVGTFMIFEQRIDVIGRIAGQNKLDLTSESYLGKEPTRFTCALQTCKAVTSEDVCGDSMDITLFDNGC